MEKIGPFPSSKSLNLIFVSEKELAVIRLDFWSQFKFELARQTGIFYTAHIENIFASSVEELASRYQVDRYRKGLDQCAVSILRSKLWAHKIILETKNGQDKMNILYRESVDDYESIFRETDWLSN